MNNKKGSTKEAPPWNGQQRNSLEGLNMFNGANCTLNSDVNHILFWSHERSLTYRCTIYTCTYKSRYKKEIKQRLGLNSVQLNTRAKEIQHVNPDGPDQRRTRERE